MTEPDDTIEAGGLARRHLLRGGAVLAGAAGLSAVSAALAPKASAANGDPLVLGQTNTATLTTTVTVTTATTPALTLTNSNRNGPLLSLTPRTAFGETEALPTLRTGELLNTSSGPYIGLADEDGGTTTGYLPSNFDLDDLPVPIAGTPVRVLDTRSAASRDQIPRASSSTALNPSTGRLQAGSWIDVPVEVTNDKFVLDAIFFNLTAVSALGGGYLVAYPPGTRPNVSSLNFTGPSVIANGGFVGVGLYAGIYVVRIYASQSTHVIMDRTGESQKGVTADEPGTTARRAARIRPARRIVRGAGRR